MLEGDTLRTNGGRLLCVTALGDSVRLAQQRAYAALQGITCVDRPAFSFQRHPEASPGPRDLVPLFAQFVESMLRKAGTAPMRKTV